MARMMNWMAWSAWMGIAYVVGSTPFGLWIGWSRGVDIRKVDSGNIGATNVGRTLGRKWGLICFFLDVSKGLAPVAVYSAMAGPMGDSVGAAGQWVGIAAATVLGHVFSFWLKFRGGKGVATALGALLGVWPILSLPGVACGLVWLIFAKTTGYISLASMAAAITLPIATTISAFAFGLSAGQIGIFVAVTSALALLVIVRHRSNLAKLREGTESKAAWTNK